MFRAGALILLAVFLSAAEPIPSQPRVQSAVPSGEQQNNAAQGQGTTTLLPSPFFVQPVIQGPTYNLHWETYSNEELRGFLGVPPDGWVAIFTGLLFGSTFLLWWATERAIRKADKASQRQLRAYVGVKELDAKLHLNVKQIAGVKAGEPGWTHEDFLVVKIKNSGQTPAYEVFVHTSWQPTDFGTYLPENFGYQDQFDPVGENVALISNYDIVDAGQEKSAIIPIRKPDIFHKTQKKKSWLFIYGHIDYRDIYGENWVRTFCVIWEPWSPVGLHFIPIGTYNEEKNVK